MRKSIVIFVSALVFLLSAVYTNIFAQSGIESAVEMGVDSIAPDMIKLPYQQGTFFGQNHSYSVVFRGNGEAVVSVRAAIGNSTERSIEELNFRIPKVQATGIYIFQIFKEKQCIRYTQPLYDTILQRFPPSVCAEYQDPDYYNDYSYYNAKYKKADFEYENDTLKVKLPTPVASGKSGAIFVYFRAMGYAKKNAFGSFDYTFETLQAEDPIQSLNIGLSTDSDLFMKGVQGEVNYRFSDATASIAKLGTGGGEMGAVSPAMDSFVSSIGQGSIYKSASNLSPLESYEVKGAFSDSRAKLYGREIAIGIGVAVGVIVIFVVLVTVVIKLLRKSSNPPGEKKTVDSATEKPIRSSTGNGRMFAIITILGFIDSLVVTVYTVLAVLLGTFISRNIGYSFIGLAVLALVIISVLIYLLLIITPGILIGMKKGVGWGIGTVVSIVLWLIFWIFIVFVLLFLFGREGGVYEILRSATPVMY